MKKLKFDQNNWPFPLWIAHRGGGNVAPENTMKGFEAGYAYGLTGVEFDVKLSKDGYPIVIHDDDFNRVGGKNLKVRDLLLEDIVSKIEVGIAYPTYFPAYVPTFEEVARFCVKRHIATNVEIKACDEREIETAERVAHDAMRYWEKSKLLPLFSSFSILALETVQKLYPKSMRGLLIEDWSLGTKGILAELKRLGCVSLHAPEKELTRKRLKAIQDQGYVVLTWTVNDLSRAQELVDWGVQGIITDLIDKAPVPALLATESNETATGGPKVG
ncbi:MAG: glycerophosphodiester phosphodiesterase [Haemophilus parainfluenzae]|jgi:glycerophosphodiester phosphodiesterase|nr:MAG: glycerophosphodiester phosphodiesterase [Haemophilus parainfluenzae]